MRKVPAALLVIALACSTGCGGCHKPAGRARVVASIFPVFDLVRTIAGPDADVALVPQGSPPGAAAGARVVVMVGLGFDPWMETTAPPGARVLKVADRVPTIGGDEGPLDPHVWLDPARARLFAKAIGEELARADAAHAIAYRQREEALDARLDALDKEIAAKAATWKTRAFVTQRDTFDYFADRYGLAVVATVEPAADVTDLVHRAHAPVFAEWGIDRAAAEALAEKAGVPFGGVLDPLGGHGGETDGYEKLLRSDVAALARALQ